MRPEHQSKKQKTITVLAYAKDGTKQLRSNEVSIRKMAYMRVFQQPQPISDFLHGVFSHKKHPVHKNMRQGVVAGWETVY